MAVCRICLLLNGEINIFTNSDQDVRVSEMLTDCAPIEVNKKLNFVLKSNSNIIYFKISENDGLPTSVCPDCLNKLTDAYALRKQIITADSKLRQTQYIKNDCESSEETEKKLCRLNNLSPLKEEDTNNCENDNDYSDYSSEDDIPLINKKKLRNTKNTYGNKAKVKRKKEKVTYSCNECQKTFKNRYYFEVHNTKHTGFKPYTCDICKKGFSMRWVLNMHSRVHTGVKPYSCDVCGKLFRFASALPNHMRIHTGKVDAALCS